MQITLNAEQTRRFLEFFVAEAVELAKRRLKQTSDDEQDDQQETTTE